MHLITSFPIKNHPRIEEYGTCLRLNLFNRSIKKITIVTDVFSVPFNLGFTNLIRDFKISFNKNKCQSKGNEILVIDSWPKYNDMFNVANSINSDYSIITNGDIFLDESISFLKNINWESPKKMIALTRRESSLSHDPIENHISLHSWKEQEKPHSTDGVCDFLSILEMRPNKFRGSADAWAFKGKIKEFGEDVELGTSYCDHAIASLAEQSGYKIYNPCLEIAANHLHKSTEGRHQKAKTQKIYRKGIEIPKLTPITRIKDMK